MDVTSTTSVTKTTSSDTVVSNPNAELDQEDFLNLFLTELQNQDPTSPVETAQMLEQTAQMSDLQTMTSLEETLGTLTDTLSNSSQFSIVDSIGKMADTGYNAINISDADGTSSVDFELFYDDDFTNSTITILGANGDEVKSFDLEEGEGGITTYTWDLTDKAGNKVEEGSYIVSATYTDSSGAEKSTVMGAYPIESVKFEDGEAYLKLGSSYYALSDVVEIY